MNGGDSAMECVFCHSRNMHDKMTGRKTAYETIFGATCDEPQSATSPSSKGEERLHQFGQQMLPGVAGNVFRGRWLGLIADCEDREMFSLRYARRLTHQALAQEGMLWFSCAGSLKPFDLPRRPTR